ncbi:MAG TPA: class I SAM-dependent methyltransferase family protein [Thermoplasmatales archaeon]|nr:class I SAM-dependent methyltransferase family protein [Thermoplasmatales archaeon]
MAIAIVVNKKMAEEVKEKLIELSLLDDTRRIKRYDDKVEIPVKKIPDIEIDFEVVKQNEYISRKKFVPFEEVKNMLRKKISENDFKNLPRKWEKFGDVLILKMDKIEKKKKVAKVYAKVLKCKSVLEDVGGIKGIERKPFFNFVYGNDALTIHIENGIKYKFDASKIMFSSGNIDERIRMAKIAEKNETVVDMFAGIGYFTLPIAVYSKSKVYACEINPIAYEFLKENISINGVNGLVEPILGDCRIVAPRRVADRVIMGYFNSIDFLEHAIEILKKRGIIHFHQKCRKEDFPEKVLEEIKKICKKHKKKVDVLFYRKIKSYAPHIVHGVIDLKIS